MKKIVMTGGGTAGHVTPNLALAPLLREQGYETDISGKRLHHEIYLSDPGRTAPEKLKTVIRHPIRRTK